MNQIKDFTKRLALVLGSTELADPIGNAENELRDFIVGLLPKEKYPYYNEYPDAKTITATPETIVDTLQTIMDSCYNAGYKACIDKVMSNATKTIKER